MYVRSFPEPREKLRISTAGGSAPEWGTGGRELFYLSHDGKLMVVTLKLDGTSPEASLPRELFALQTDGFKIHTRSLRMVNVFWLAGWRRVRSR